MYCKRKEAKLLAYEYDSDPADRHGKYPCSTSVSCLSAGSSLDPQQRHRGTSRAVRDYAHRSSLPDCLIWRVMVGLASVALSMCAYYAVAQGQIQLVRVYYDTATMGRQLGWIA